MVSFMHASIILSDTFQLMKSFVHAFSGADLGFNKGGGTDTF